MLGVGWFWIPIMGRPVAIGIVLINPHQFVGERERILLKVESPGMVSGLLVGGGAAGKKRDNSNECCRDPERPIGKRTSQLRSAGKRPYIPLLHAHRKVAAVEQGGVRRLGAFTLWSWPLANHVPACRENYPRAT